MVNFCPNPASSQAQLFPNLGVGRVDFESLLPWQGDCARPLDGDTRYALAGCSHLVALLLCVLIALVALGAHLAAVNGEHATARRDDPPPADLLTLQCVLDQGEDARM